MNRPRVNFDMAPYFRDEGEPFVVEKFLVVCHETISGDQAGIGDIRGVAQYLDDHGLEIHGMIDLEGNFAWAKGLRRAIFDHCTSRGSRGYGKVAARSIGIELVAYPRGSIADKRAYWQHRSKQLRKLAQVLAWLSTVEPIPLDHSDSSFGRPGVTTHYDVTKRWGVAGGHTDCFPTTEGGYFPLRQVLRDARELV